MMKLLVCLGLIVVVCAIRGPKPPKALGADIGQYPGYDERKAEGDVTLRFEGTKITFEYDLKNLEASVSGGLHIHVGTTCNTATDLGGHYWNKGADGKVEDPWTTTYTSDANGVAKGEFKVDAGYMPKDLDKHAVVLHAADGAIRIGCGLLQQNERVDDDESKESESKESGGPPDSKTKPDSKDECDYRKMGKSTCTSPTECAEGVRSKRVGCCLTCKPAKKPKCTKEMKDECKASIESLPDCDGKKKSKKYDKTKCCLTCKRPTKKKKEKCSKEDKKACRMDNATHVCEDGEEPMKLDGQCCYSCKRSESDKEITDIAKCANLEECAADETPVIVAGSKCRSCKKPRPICDENCGFGKVCARDRESEEKGKCKPKKVLTYLFKGVTAAVTEFLKNATAEEIRAALVEVVNRFCEDVDNAKLCASKTEVIDSIMVLVQKRLLDSDDDAEDSDEAPSDSTVVVEVTVADAPAPVDVEVRRRRLLEASSTLLENAMKDPDSTGGLSLTPEASAANNNPVSAAFAAQVPATVVALLVIAIAVVA